ncbi:DUF3885 domain-containing protein [Sporosarcina sp. JAI121]|uniref:DUF3885 domain-containing protein n=1 Tax=Sporosarcina sp. JAI121 TaxID=2723064 RepID=UPI0015CE7918|nr:DUF3885 domain-containing protein [Sporosarcina sp. JAI121]NYF26122.1 hypothetical protein [Sporosarcina sp. JAI121]
MKEKRGINMFLNDYMSEKFPNLKLKPPLFYNWDTGIRFELGNPDDNDEVSYMKTVYHRSLSIFKSLHSVDDEIVIVANVHHDDEQNLLKRRKLKIFNHYIKSKNVLYRLQHKVIPYVFEDEYDIYDFETHRYTLQCNVSDVKYINFIKAICNHDMDIKPKIYHDVFIINKTKNTIFHIYDDRGCDVLSLDKESLGHLYKKYNDWILDYDRSAIDKTFQ